MVVLKESFIQRIGGAFGEAGADWLRSLPSILDQVSQKWEITLRDPYDDLSYNFVAQAIHKDGTHVVLKLGVPNQELLTEKEALRLFNGRGAVKLIRSDYDLGALLLELLQPGTPVFQLQDDEAATRIAGHVMSQLWVKNIDESMFPSVADWAGGFQKFRNKLSDGNGSFPDSWVDVAEGLFMDLISSMEETVLLHGDLHHWNILSAQRQPWLAIDPKGVIGEPAYEIGAWLRNPFPYILAEQYPDRLILRRAEQLSEELGFDRKRLLAWGLAQAILAAWWSYIDTQDDWQLWLEVAAIFDKII